MLVEQHGLDNKNRVTLNNFNISAGTLRDVKEGLITEIERETSRLKKELTDKELGARGIDHRVAQAEVLNDRLTRYETMLGESLASCQNAINDTLDVLAASVAELEDEEVFEEAFA